MMCRKCCRLLEENESSICDNCKFVIGVIRVV